MNSKTHPCFPYPSKGLSLQLNGWVIAALLLSAGTRWWPGHESWSLIARNLIAILPVIPLIFYARTFARWVRGLDELQQRIQLRAWFFAAMATIYATMIVGMLQSANVLRLTQWEHGLPWEGVFGVMIIAHIIGSIIASREYR